jgi:peroxiredoxin
MAGETHEQTTSEKKRKQLKILKPYRNYRVSTILDASLAEFPVLCDSPPMKHLARLLLPLVLLCTAPLLHAEPKASGDAPVWELKDVDGKAVKLSDFKGKVVILDFWATWCPPCRKEIPGFVELQEAYKDKGLVVIGVSLDEEGAAVVKPFMTEYKVNYPMVIGDGKTVEAYGGISGIPTTFIIDKEGKIKSVHVGYRPKETFEAEIKALL